MAPAVTWWMVHLLHVHLNTSFLQTMAMGCSYGDTYYSSFSHQNSFVQRRMLLAWRNRQGRGRQLPMTKKPRRQPPLPPGYWLQSTFSSSFTKRSCTEYISSCIAVLVENETNCRRHAHGGSMEVTERRARPSPDRQVGRSFFQHGAMAALASSSANLARINQTHRQAPSRAAQAVWERGSGIPSVLVAPAVLISLSICRRHIQHKQNVRGHL